MEFSNETSLIAHSKESKRKSIVVAVWLIVFLTSGNMKAVGVLLPILQDQFETYTRTIGVIVSLLTVSGNVIAILMQPLTRMFAIRSIIITTGILSTVGLIICSVAPSTSVLVFGLFIAGSTFANYILALGTVSTYFTKYYHVAMSITTTGLPLGIMCFTPITQFFIDVYGWRGTLVLLSAIQFHSVAAAALLRPLKQAEVPVEYSEESLSDNTLNDIIITCLADIFKISLIRNVSFMNIAIIHAFLGYGFNGWLVYLVSISISKGLTPYVAANVVLISGIGIFIIRIILAVLPSDKFSRHLLYIGSVIMTLAYGGMYWAFSVMALSIQSCLLGIGYGILGTQLFVAMNACVSQEDIHGAVAWMTMTEGIAYFIGGYVTGYLYDQTGSFNLSLITLSLVSSFMFVGLGVEDLLRTLKRRINGIYTRLR